MNFVSTKDQDYTVKISQAIAEGLAPNKGLFVPETYPKFDFDKFLDFDNLIDLAYDVLQPFFEDDPLSTHLKTICKNTFDFPIPLKPVDERVQLLELFHGPTGAFKDIGAKFLAQCFSHMEGDFTILVATSGDTGSAVSAAFYQQPNTRVIVLYPKDKISQFQENQLVYWDSNIQPVRVDGDFDKCQQLVIEAFSTEELSETYRLSSANSINIARLLPQCIYYVYASLVQYNSTGKFSNFYIPTGNMGNAFAAIIAKHLGFPINKIHIGTNENRVIPEYFKSGIFEPRASKRTIANAMDVGNPSNFERYSHLINLYPEIENDINTTSVSDEEIKKTIGKVYTQWDQAICPHTATAVHHFYEKNNDDAIIVATAHPYKFRDIVESIIDGEITVPGNLKRFIEVTPNVIDIKPTLDQLKSVIVNE